MDLNEFLKLRYNFLKKRNDESNDIATQIRISAKLHELKIILKFMNDKNTDDIFTLR